MFTNSLSFNTYGRKVCENRIFPPRPPGVNKIYYINSGSIVCKVGAKEYTLDEGFLYLIPQNLSSALQSDYVDHTYFDFFSTPTIVSDEIIKIKLCDHPILSAAFLTLNLLVEEQPLRKSPISDTEYELVKSYFDNFLFLMNKQALIPTVDDIIVNDAIAYMQNHYSLKISVSELAERYHLEKNVFIRRFKKYTNTTPHKYLKTLRVNIALSLKKKSSFTLTEIAEMVGYSDAAALSHSIRKWCSDNNNFYIDKGAQK